MKLWVLRLLIASSILPACSDGDDQIGVPQPEPFPLVSKIRSTYAWTSEPQSLELVGLPGTVVGSGTIAAQTAHAEEHTTSTNAGSFFLRVTAAAREKIVLRYNRSDPVPFTIPGPPCPAGQICNATELPSPQSGVPPISAAGDGKVTIRGQTLTATQVIVVNSSTGAVATAAIEADGRFELIHTAEAGQVIHVYRDNDTGLSDAWVLEVP